MAENKKGFVLYADLIHTVELMTSSKAGNLFKHILRYVNDLNPKTGDTTIKLVFEPIKQQLKRDLKKYEERKKKYSDAGKRSAEVRREKQKATSLNAVKQGLTKSTVIVKDTVTVNVKDNVKVITINNRMAEFKNSLQPFLEKYGNEMLNDFYLYWTEKRELGRKMRFEMEKTWDFSRRLQRWFKNDFSTKEKTSKKKSVMETLKEREQNA